ncbi:alpha/beta hydrolase family protein [Lentilactobacillus kosonis]|uniref:OrfZ protein n=1 Tax=Lentilactobacillus kosonis TaxID=2810561 RepID=A0A401FIG9_9LACO|nr:alpha/beta hydrolase [Lentilactobacillus kosonis]GAY72088.1 OrfZ protein [Lentilactobacillus kosonis]
MLRTANYATYGGADLGEVLSTGYKIQVGNFESWYAEWLDLADRVTERAQVAIANDDDYSAGTNLFKASNYYRTAEFFLHGNPDDPRITTTWQKSRDTFRQALKLRRVNAEIVAIPYEKTTMPGYFYRVDNLSRPTLIIHGGFDSTGEELYFQVVQDALVHGYNCLTFDGPGQGAMIREQNIGFRNDWENVVSPVIDYLLTRDDVVADQIALMGISFGGLLAPRAAAFDHRLAAVVADDGLFSFQFSAAFRGHSEGLPSDDVIENEIKKLMTNSTQVRWVIDNGMYTFKANTVMDLFAATEPYTLANVADKIECPVFVAEAEMMGSSKANRRCCMMH